MSLRKLFGIWLMGAAGSDCVAHIFHERPVCFATVSSAGTRLTDTALARKGLISPVRALDSLTCLERSKRPSALRSFACFGIPKVPSEAAAQLVGGLAALLGRYSMVRPHALAVSFPRGPPQLPQASEIGVGLWRSDLGQTGCQPLRVSLLRCEQFE